jgi:hypothetical protein
MEETYYRVISVKLHTFLIRKVELAAINSGSNKSEVIRNILLDYISNFSQKPLISSRAELLVDGDPDSRSLITVKVPSTLYEKVVDIARKYNTTISSVVISALYYAFKDNKVTIMLNKEDKNKSRFRVCPICGLIVLSSFESHLLSHKRIHAKDKSRLIKYRDIMLLAQEAVLQADRDSIKEVLTFIKNNYSSDVYKTALRRTKSIYSKINDFI